MLVARAPGRGNARAECGPSFIGASNPGKELAVLEVSRDVFRMRSQDGLEMLIGCGGIACVGALHRQAVEGERVIGLGGDELFEHLAPRFLLWLGHGGAHSIFALGPNTKSPREPGAIHEEIHRAKKQ